jgi:hypothetical protein
MIWAEFDKLERRISSAHIDALPSDALQSTHEGFRHRNKMIDQYVGYKLGLRPEEVEAVFDKRDGVFPIARGAAAEKKPRKSKRPAKSQAAAKAKKKKSAKTSAVLSRKRK